MRHRLTLTICAALCAVALTCKKEPPPAVKETPKPGTGKRDYVWSIDSVYYGTLPGPIKLQNIWGSSARDVWGVNGDSPDVRDCLWHYDGTRWTRATAGTPITEFTGNKVVYDIWGSARNDVWAVGRKINRDTLSAFLMHYNGVNWRDATPPNVYRLQSNLYTIRGFARDDIWVGGYEYALHYNGSDWVAYRVADSMTVIGIDKWNGNTYAAFASPWGGQGVFLSRLISGTFGKMDSTTQLEKKFSLLFYTRNARITTFTNGIITNTISDSGSIDPTTWRRELTTPTFFTFVWYQSSNNVFATGQWNLFYHYNGADWKPMRISVPNHTVNPLALLGRVWTDGNELFVSDYDNGVVYHGR